MIHLRQMLPLHGIYVLVGPRLYNVRTMSKSHGQNPTTFGFDMTAAKSHSEIDQGRQKLIEVRNA